MSTTWQATTEQAAPGELTGVHEQRAQLRAAMNGVEAALSSALAGRVVEWAAELEPAMMRLRDSVNRHITVTEGPGGLFEQIQTDSARLSGAVQRLHSEHERFQVEIDEMLAKLAEEPADPVAMGALREQITSLLGRIVRHRQRGADLINEAYQVDIGGG
ncbi:MAG: hypothetical protein ABI912_07505 [Actinomycetota bacterium]